MTDAIATAVARLLEHLGFEVERLQEGKGKTPDLVAVKEGEVFLIEVKSKHDDRSRGQQMEEAFKLDSVFEEVVTLGPRNRVSAIVQHGVRQLQARRMGDPLRLLWFTALGQRADVYARQIRATLLGSTRVIDLRELSWQRECYFFYNSGFYRWQKELDGAIIARIESGQLLINSFSPRAGRLRYSPMAVTFGRGVLDPIALAARGDACIVEGDVDRKDEAAVQRFLQEKYERPMLQGMDLGHYAVWVGFPAEELLLKEEDSEP